MVARSALVAGLLALGWSAAVLASGGFDLRPVGVPIIARTPWPTTIAAIALLLASFAFNRSAVAASTEAIAVAMSRRAVWLALGLSLASGAAAVRFGTAAVGGSDSNCYVAQAERWAAGTMMEPVHPGFSPDWPNAALSLTPTGFVPSRRVEGAIAPICPAGLALAMALPRALGAPRGSVFAVVPICAAIVVFCTFLLGRWLVGPLGAVYAAALMATSPVFLYQSVQPMSDVPSAALWVLALACAGSGKSPGALAAGLAAGAAVLVRPNLAPLAGIVVAAAALGACRVAASGDSQADRLRRGCGGPHVRAGWPRRGALATLGLLPGVLGVGVVQHVLYGSALSSGYGNPGLLFRLEHVGANLSRYPRWLIETQSPFVLAGLAAPFALWALARTSADERQPRYRGVAWAVVLCLFSLAAFAAYLPYVPFDGWWFVRFWLPGLPPLLVLAIATASAGARLLTRAVARDRNTHAEAPVSSGSPTRLGAVLKVAGVLGCTALAAWQLGVARDRSVFQLQRFERKFVASGEYVATLPPDAVVLTIWHSGAVWYYGHRPAIMWDAVAPDGLDDVVASLRRQGREVYLLLEPSEEGAFRARFDGRTPTARLDWPPRARFGNEVTLWALDDRDRFLRGETVQSERVWGR